MASQRSWILKFPRADGRDDPILIQVTGNEQDDLHLDLIGTDGEVVYGGKIRSDKLEKLKHRNNTGSDEEFASLIRYVLVSKETSNFTEDQKRGLEVKIEIEIKHSKRRLHIVFRNRIDEITQRLGSVELKQTDEEISFLDWTANAVDRADKLQEEQEGLHSQLREAQDTINALQTQLDDLVKAKTDHEDQILSKFVLLLNEKKLKIRNQQRLLTSMDIDKNKVENTDLKEESQSQKDGLGIGHTPKKSHPGKRKAKTPPPADDDDDSSDAFESMKVDVDPRIEDEQAEMGNSGRETTPETASETESETAASKAAPKVGRLGGKPVNGGQPKKTATPPPRRDLPFDAKGKAAESRAGTQPVENTAGSDEETASDDDEL